MKHETESGPSCRGATRRAFLKHVGQGAVAGALAAAAEGAAAPAEGGPGRVKARELGQTGLRVSEIGFGGHSWSYARVPDGRGGLRKPTREEAERMISLGVDMGVNFFDACTPPEEHTVPAEVIRRLKIRDRVIISARLCHKMKGVPADRVIMERWVKVPSRLRFPSVRAAAVMGSRAPARPGTLPPCFAKHMISVLVGQYVPGQRCCAWSMSALPRAKYRARRGPRPALPPAGLHPNT